MGPYYTSNFKNLLPNYSDPPIPNSGYSPTAVCSSDSFYKTKLCPRIRSNSFCRRNNDCPFAHYREELRPLPDLRKTKLCNNYVESKRCFAGSACTFAHGKHELRDVNGLMQGSFEGYPKGFKAQAPDYRSRGSAHTEQDEMTEKLRQLLKDYFSNGFEKWANRDELNGGAMPNSAFARKDYVSYYDDGFSPAQESHNMGTPTNFAAAAKFKRTRRGKRGGKNRSKVSKELSFETDFQEAVEMPENMELLMKMLANLYRVRMPNETEVDPQPREAMMNVGDAHSVPEWIAPPTKNASYRMGQNHWSVPGESEKLGDDPTFSNFPTYFSGSGDVALTSAKGGNSALFDSLKSMMSTLDSYPTEGTTFSYLSMAEPLTEAEQDERTTATLPQSYYPLDRPSYKVYGSESPNGKQLEKPFTSYSIVSQPHMEKGVDTR